MSWLGNGFREEAKSLADAYSRMYEGTDPNSPAEQARRKKQAELKAGNDTTTADYPEGYGAKKEEVETEQEELTEKEGKKDACYHKVKSRYDVWPSAYASGALVKCRAKGAKNWGNSSKKEAFDDALGELIQEGETFAGISEEDAWDAFLFGWEEGEQLNEKVKTMPEETELLASMADAYNMVYEKKSKKKDSDKCGDDTYWDKEEKKCKSKKKSSKTVVVGRGGIYGPGYHGGGGGSNGGDGETDPDGGDGGDGGGDGGGGGE